MMCIFWAGAPLRVRMLRKYLHALGAGEGRERVRGAERTDMCRGAGRAPPLLHLLCTVGHANRFATEPSVTSWDSHALRHHVAVARHLQHQLASGVAHNAQPHGARVCRAQEVAGGA